MVSKLIERPFPQPILDVTICGQTICLQLIEEYELMVVCHSKQVQTTRCSRNGSKQLDISTTCTLCSNYPETVDHTLQPGANHYRDSPYYTIFGIRGRNTILSSQPPSFIGLLSLTVPWLIWVQDNGRIFNHKTFHFPQVDCRDTLRIRLPQLMMALTTDGQLHSHVAKDVEKIYGVSLEKKNSTFEIFDK